MIYHILRKKIHPFSPFDSELQQDRSDLEAIRAYSKLKGVNYIQAKRILNDTRVLVAAGTAYDMRELLNRLAQFQVQYEISPPYPYPY